MLLGVFPKHFAWSNVLDVEVEGPPHALFHHQEPHELGLLHEDGVLPLNQVHEAKENVELDSLGRLHQFLANDFLSINFVVFDDFHFAVLQRVFYEVSLL